MRMYSFTETRLFTKLVQQYLTDDEYAELQRWLTAQPESGRVIPGSGGVRSFGGGPEGEASAALTGLSTTCAEQMESSGC